VRLEVPADLFVNVARRRPRKRVALECGARSLELRPATLKVEMLLPERERAAIHAGADRERIALRPFRLHGVAARSLERAEVRLPDGITGCHVLTARGNIRGRDLVRHRTVLVFDDRAPGFDVPDGELSPRRRKADGVHLDDGDVLPGH